MTTVTMAAAEGRTGRTMSGDKWLADGNIEVDIHQLQDFANHIKDELEKNFRPSFESGIKPMLTVQAPFGAGGLSEAKFFRSRHDESRASAASMMGEVMKGLASLSAAAMSISAEYLGGDAFSQATSEKVLDAFTGVGGEQTIDDLAKQDGGKNDPAGAVPEDAKDPKKYFGDDGTKSDPNGQTPTMYQQSEVGKGDGEYTIQGDNENMHDPKLKMPTYKQ